MLFIFTSREVDRDLKSDVMVNSPSRFSNVLVFVGVASSVATSVRRVEAWIAGHEVGSRRSSRSFVIFVSK